MSRPDIVGVLGGRRWPSAIRSSGTWVGPRWYEGAGPEWPAVAGGRDPVCEPRLSNSFLGNSLPVAVRVKPGSLGMLDVEAVSGDLRRQSGPVKLVVSLRGSAVLGKRWARAFGPVCVGGGGEKEARSPLDFSGRKN